MTYPLIANSVASSQIVNRSTAHIDYGLASIALDNIEPSTVVSLRTPNANSVDAGTVQDGTLTEADLNAAVKAKLNAAGPTYLKHWGTVHRNVIGRPTPDSPRRPPRHCSGTARSTCTPRPRPTRWPSATRSTSPGRT
ncbi:hypothetical protein [Kribbella sp. VKM Ac-2568]|uniref:hypothetical protein n=1 Tax=Kribbella sp. VKM Ac-2568 TaxID=2512219 RepID=UPI00104FEAD0|nr:hypothetical protein [Kribbella sp. VKM Ac-2568]